jgi:RimJ/RimL family protein N-acetyltransferase
VLPFLEVFSDNASAISLCKKFGFVGEGQKVKAIKIRNEKYYDLIEMAFLRNSKRTIRVVKNCT